jgi:pimeloyl-ACP methyl ester carboxylesterase
MTTFLLVHGAWHGSWCWDRLIAELGGDVHTVDLPSSGSTAGVHDDAEVVKAQLKAIDGPVVVLAHSYGGVPVTQALADAPNVEHVVFLAAYQLDEGESVFGIHGAPTPDDLDTSMPPDAGARTKYYADVPEADAAAAIARLRPQSIRSGIERITSAGWRTVPSTYIVCEQDQALPPALQERFAAKSGAVHRLASSHSPFLSMPAELAALLTKIAADA